MLLQVFLAVLKTSFSKNKQKEISYWHYKNFNSNVLDDELNHAFLNLVIDTCEKFNKFSLKF